MDNENRKLHVQWQQRLKLRSESNKLRAKGYKLWDKSYKLRAEGDKLWAESCKLRFEDNKLWADSIIAVFGNIVMNWMIRGSGSDFTDPEGSVYKWDEQLTGEENAV